LSDWYNRLFAATFPGERKLPFELNLRSVKIGTRNQIGGLGVTPFQSAMITRRDPASPTGLRWMRKIFCYSGDTEWTDALFEVARGADLFIAECYMFEKVIRAHLSLSTLREKLPAIGANRVILTHLSDDMLSRAPAVEFEMATDGKVIAI
jgi:ribonuclease BN (tRNA processing enzyme)